MQINQKLLAVWKSLITSNKIIVSIEKGKRGQQVYLRHENKSIFITYLMDLPKGDAIAVLTDRGNWFLLGVEEQIQNTSSKRTIQYRQSYNNPSIIIPGGFVMWLDCNWLQYSNENFLNQIIDIFLINNSTNIVYTSRKNVYQESTNTFGLLEREQNPPLGGLVDSFKSYEIIEVDFENPDPSLTFSDGLLLYPLYHYNTRISEVTANLLLDAAKNNFGAIILGEWDVWKEYDNAILDALVGNRIRFGNSCNDNRWVTVENQDLGITSNSITISATGTFVGAFPTEVLATRATTNEPTVIYVKPENMI